jgi:hypothetical protein
MQKRSVSKSFAPGTFTAEIADYIKDRVKVNRAF